MLLTVGWGWVARAGDATRLVIIPPEYESPTLCPAYGPLTTVGAAIYFADRADLLKIDPVTGSVDVVRDLQTGTRSMGAIGPLVGGDGRLFFLASDGDRDGELWTSDGTTAGTTPVFGSFALNPGAGVSDLTVFGARAFFGALYPYSETGVLWLTDGTVEGTAIATGITNPGPMLATRVGVALGSRSAVGLTSTLWVTDGTGVGSARLATLGSDTSVAALVPFGTGALAWIMRGASAGTPSYELWRTGLTPATTGKVAVEAPPSGVWTGETEFWNAEAGNLAFSVVNVGGYTPTLLRTDGTAAGTYTIAPTGFDYFSPSPRPFIVPLGSAVVFEAFDTAHGAELWRSDGTSAGTTLLADISPGPSSSLPQWLTSAGDRVYFTANAPETGRELWVTDGTPAGTRLVLDLCPGTCGAFREARPEETVTPSRVLVALNGEAVFVASSGAGGCRVWTSDGNAGGTRALSDSIPSGSVWPIDAPAQLEIDGSVILKAGDPSHLRGPFRTEGTPGSFAPLTTIPLSSLSASGEGPRLHGQMYAAAAGAIWRVDGTSEGSASIFPGRMDFPSNASAGVFFFWRNGWELWRSDGTGRGTRRVRSFPPGTDRGGGR